MSRVSGTGIYGNYVVPRENPDDVPELTAEQVKVAYEAAVREDQAAQDRIETQKNADAFIAGHKEFVDNVANSQLLLNQARTMFGDGLITVPMWEQAYQYLREHTDFLKLDKKELANQQKAAARQRYEQEKLRSAVPTEEEMYAMPIDELRRRDAIATQERMRRIGEEGGW